MVGWWGGGGGSKGRHATCSTRIEPMTPQIILLIPTTEYRGCASGGSYVPCVHSHAR